MKDYLPLRRGQLITTFGPGALVISPEGESAMIGALDKWFYNIKEIRSDNLEEFEIDEPSLKTILKVNKLLQPPDFRPSYKYNGGGNSTFQTNTDIYIPLLRFPTWHYCPVCKTLHRTKLSNRTNWIDCCECKAMRKMIQVPFVIICKNGHIADFPWSEWVHRNEDTTCEGTMKLNFTGGATLDSLKITCSCGAERSLRGITSKSTSLNDDDDNVVISELSLRLNEQKGKYYVCPGNKPWFGKDDEKESCNAYPFAVLKNSLNVYYPNTISAIYLPGGNPNVESIIDMFEKCKITPSILSTAESKQNKIKLVRKLCPPEISEYNDEDIELAIIYIESGERGLSTDIQNSKKAEEELRKKEFETLIKEIDSRNLKVKKEWYFGNISNNDFRSYFQLINRVTKLKETIVLFGFSRLATDDAFYDIEIGKKLLFKDWDSKENNWLPAYKVYGEGIFFTLNINKIKEWEEKNEVKDYFTKMLTRIIKNTKDYRFYKARNILLHTLSHIIIDELALTCGYNAASIKERLYLEEDNCGVLIYTSSGDIDGTFGGLVRMGREKNFFPIVYKAIEKAKWCSSDPVCSEIGKTSGQGVNFVNGASCHSCSYLPETSCENGNLFLDRTLLIDEKIGFFNGVI